MFALRESAPNSFLYEIQMQLKFLKLTISLSRFIFELILLIQWNSVMCFLSAYWFEYDFFHIADSSICELWEWMLRGFRERINIFYLCHFLFLASWFFFLDVYEIFFSILKLSLILIVQSILVYWLLPAHFQRRICEGTLQL